MRACDRRDLYPVQIINQRYCGSEAADANRNRIIDAFMLKYWREFTSLDHVFLVGKFRGNVSIRIIEVDEEREERVLVEWSGVGEGSIHLSVMDGIASSCASYLYADVISNEDDAEVELIHWASLDYVVNSKLTVVVCTYKREDALVDNLKILASLSKYVGAVYVINNGDPGLRGRLVARWPGLVDVSYIRFFDQANKGGASGFTRGMIEAKSDGCTGHLILMDDDVAVMDKSLANTFHLVSYLKNNICIGGAMLDLHDRFRLISVGNVINRKWPGVKDVVPSGGIDVRNIRSLDYYIRDFLKIDYCGWWYFVLPLSVIDGKSLPLPLFIRGDDADYGLYLKCRGYKTIPWPSIAIWHENFVRKDGLWQVFYDRRNAYFRGELYGYYGRLVIAYSLVRSIFFNSICFKYDRAAVEIEAVRAFNSGGRGLVGWGEEDHHHLQALRDPDYSGCVMAEATDDSTQYSMGMGLIVSTIRLIGDLWGRGEGLGAVRIKRDSWNYRLVVRPLAIYVESSSRFYEYRYSRGRVRDVWRRGLWEVIRLLFFRRLNPSHLGRLRCASFWKKYLDVRD